jgi:hypothetical protein
MFTFTSNGTRMEIIMDFSQYKSDNTEPTALGYRASLYHGIPIAYRGAFRDYARSIGLVGYRVLYRGPRNGRHNGQSICPRSMATSFAVYRK